MLKSLYRKGLIWLLALGCSQTSLLLPALAAPSPSPQPSADEGGDAGLSPESLMGQPSRGPERATVPADEAIDTPGAILDYRVGINDRLQINFWSPTLRYNQEVVVPLEGNVFLTPVGEVRVVGLTTTQIRDALQRQIQAHSPGARVSVLLQVTHTIRVYVTGLVKHPGAFTMNALSRFSNALNMAGGALSEGSLRRMVLKHQGQERRVDWQKFISFGDDAHNPRLQAGDIIVVRPAVTVATITGAVNKTGTYEFLPGETVGMLISLAHGLHSSAAPGQATIAHIPLDPAKEPLETPIDLSTAQGLRTRLVDRTVVNIPSNTLSYVKSQRTRVQITGEVNAPSEYVLTLGNSLRDLFSAAGGPKSSAGLREVKIYHRSAGGGLNYEHVSIVDAYKLLYENDEAQNVKLVDGDLVSVPVSKSPVESSTVFVYGQVGRPGKVPYRAGYRLSDYLNQSGGPLPKANLGGVTITRVREKGKSEKIAVDAAKIMPEGRQDLDPVLQEGEIVDVPESFFFIANWQDFVSTILAAAAIFTLFRR